MPLLSLPIICITHFVVRGGGLFSISLFLFMGGGIVAFSFDILVSMGRLHFLILTLLVYLAG